jgi:hypothetical protein
MKMKPMKSWSYPSYDAYGDDVGVLPPILNCSTRRTRKRMRRRRSWIWAFYVPYDVSCDDRACALSQTPSLKKRKKMMRTMMMIPSLSCGACGDAQHLTLSSMRKKKTRKKNPTQVSCGAYDGDVCVHPPTQSCSMKRKMKMSLKTNLSCGPSCGVSCDAFHDV